MRCECSGEVMTYRIAAEAGSLNCCNGSHCAYQPGDYIVTLANPLKPGETCEAALTKGMFDSACKVIA
jgi:hypothetical protein